MTFHKVEIFQKFSVLDTDTVHIHFVLVLGSSCLLTINHVVPEPELRHVLFQRKLRFDVTSCVGVGPDCLDIPHRGLKTRLQRSILCTKQSFPQWVFFYTTASLLFSLYILSLILFSSLFCSFSSL